MSSPRAECITATFPEKKPAEVNGCDKEPEVERDGSGAYLMNERPECWRVFWRSPEGWLRLRCRCFRRELWGVCQRGLVHDETKEVGTTRFFEVSASTTYLRDWPNSRSIPTERVRMHFPGEVAVSPLDLWRGGECGDLQLVRCRNLSGKGLLQHQISPSFH